MVVLRGISNLSEIPLPSNDFGIGRFYNPDGNILVALDERSISRRHATFISDIPTREYYLTDTHSSYGTRIQIGNRFETLTPGKAQRIYNEDVIQFGHIVTVRFTLPCQTRPTGTRMY
jgi:pSer/pThr/pTyr-binding forkhead associated (FHA) protein